MREVLFLIEYNLPAIRINRMTLDAMYMLGESWELRSPTPLVRKNAHSVNIFCEGVVEGEVVLHYNRPDDASGGVFLHGPDFRWNFRPRSPGAKGRRQHE